MQPILLPIRFPENVKIGRRAGVTCLVADGDPPFLFKWYKDDYLLQDDNTVTITNPDDFTSMLSIKNISAQSNGNYTCKVSNNFGSDEKSDNLLIKGKLTSVVIIFNGNFKRITFNHVQYLSFS